MFTVLLFPYRCCYLIAFGKPVRHREVAPREFDVHSIGGSPREKQKRKEGEEEEEKKKKKKKKEKKKEKKKKKKKKGRGRQSRKTEAACVASAGCNSLLIVYQISTVPSKVAPGTVYEPLA